MKFDLQIGQTTDHLIRQLCPINANHQDKHEVYHIVDRADDEVNQMNGDELLIWKDNAHAFDDVSHSEHGNRQNESANRDESQASCNDESVVPREDHGNLAETHYRKYREANLVYLLNSSFLLLHHTVTAVINSQSFLLCDTILFNIMVLQLFR